MKELQPLVGIEAHFTEFRYLSMNRSFMSQFVDDLKNKVHDHDIDEFYITVDGIELNMMKLIQNITYNEHKHVLRWDRPDWQKCICELSPKKEL